MNIWSSLTEGLSCNKVLITHWIVGAFIFTSTCVLVNTPLTIPDKSLHTEAILHPLQAVPTGITAELRGGITAGRLTGTATVLGDSAFHILWAGRSYHNITIAYFMKAITIFLQQYPQLVHCVLRLWEQLGQFLSFSKVILNWKSTRPGTLFLE